MLRFASRNLPAEVARLAWTRPGRAAGAVNAAAPAAHAVMRRARSMMVDSSKRKVHRFKKLVRLGLLPFHG